MNKSELSKYVYAILTTGQIVIATLDIDDDQHSYQTTVTQLGTGHKYPAAMVFPATPETHEALQVLYEDIKVPAIPLEPNDIVRELLEHHQEVVLIKCSGVSYADARAKPNTRIKAITNNQRWGSVSGSYKCMVPYDVHGNEITEV